MLLALLMLVVGRLGGALGGPLGGPVVLSLDTDRDMDGARGTPRLSCEGAFARPNRGSGVGIERGGGAELAIGGGGVLGAPGGGVPLTERGAALGGGGVAVFASTTSAPGFLLTQRLRSGS
jgi:hypothetical protein